MTDNFQSKPLRRIRSFVRRTGRITEGQKKAFDNNWNAYGISYEAKLLDPVELFGREAPLVLEIGFGMGTSLCEMALAEPEKNFIGIEVHLPGVGKLLQLIEQHSVQNLHIFHHDAVEVLQHCVPDRSLQRAQIYFPDPWHKRKHHKRRLLQQEFVELLQRKLKIGGILHVATDWQHYADQTLTLLQSTPGLCNTATESSDGYTPRPKWRPLTKFEQRGARLGHGIWDLVFEKLA